MTLSVSSNQWSFSGKSRDYEDKNEASSFEAINSQKKISILVILLSCLYEITLFFASTGWKPN